MFKCQKCAKQAMVHLTEVVIEAATKRTVEIHLCLGHAVEAGLVMAGPDVPPQVLSMLSGKGNKGGKGEESPTAIVPLTPESTEMVVSSERSGKGEPGGCPICGTQWNQFKQSGLMGCPHDYEMFSGKLLPLLKRAQEGAADHVGKVPMRHEEEDAQRQVTTMRLRRELRKALDAENYEEAAQLRDKLRRLERN